MLETRTHEWLSRLQGDGPRLVSWFLAVLIAVELARIAVSLLGGGPVKSPQAAVSNRSATRSACGIDTSQSVISAHLFGVATIDPSTQDPDNAPASTSNLVLTGTIATQDPKHGVAIISDGGTSKVYSVGDNIGGAALHSVYLDHVILDRGGVALWRTCGNCRGYWGPACAVPRWYAGRARILARKRRSMQHPPLGAAGPPGIFDQVMRHGAVLR